MATEPKISINRMVMEEAIICCSRISVSGDHSQGLKALYKAAAWLVHIINDQVLKYNIQIPKAGNRCR